MRQKIKILFFLFFLLITNNQTIFAVIAYPYPINITQSDGSKITIILKGDERVKWAQTLDGYSIMRNSKGVYEYAMLDSKNNMAPSGIKAHDIKERNSLDNQLLSKINKGIVYSKSQVGMMKSISNMVKNKSIQPFPTTGTVKVLCILMGFKDKAITKTQLEFTNLFNQVGYSANGASGSVHDYYLENSYNQLQLSFTVVGPYTASQNMAYYGANDASGNDLKPRELVTEAVTLADADVNYANFDNNGDGYVDDIYVIFAGNGEEAGASADAIWSHSWSIPSLTLDGKIVYDYACSPELEGFSGATTTSIGVVCHEFGHVMGASDFYDIDLAASGGEFYGTGDWDIMASGSWNNNGATPAHHNPYTKAYVYNWAPVTTISTATPVTLSNAEQNKTSFYRINTATIDEYFLIENRQKVLFDAYLPGHGMVIYHVDGSYVSSHVNNNDINIGFHQGLYPVCASATTNPGSTVSSFGSINSAGCPYPGSFGVASFNDNTTPNSHSWAGANTNMPISNISENTTNKTVSFNVTITTGVESNEIITNFLSQNYPNPFDNFTTIDFKLIKSSKVSLTVYNSLGQVVDVIVDEFLFAGSYSERWSPKGISAGIYFYQLRGEDFKVTKRFIKK